MSVLFDEFDDSAKKSTVFVITVLHEKVFVDWILSLLDKMKTEKCGR